MFNALDVGIPFPVIAIKNYTFSIPLHGQWIGNRNQIKSRADIKGLIAQHSPCKINQGFHKFPYIVVNDTILVTPLIKGQVLVPVRVKETLPPNFEVGQSFENKHKVCYPSDVVRDYIET